MANVYTSLSNAIWYTDKCSISTGSTAVTYQVYATALGSSPAAGNIYSGPPEIGPDSTKQIYVGVGNYITITGSNYTAQELGTQTSAQAGTGAFTENLTPITPVSTYTISSQPGGINSGSSGTFDITTTDVADGTTLYWTINNITSIDADFTAVSGSFVIASNAGVFDVTTVSGITADVTFTASIRTVSIAGTVVDTSDSVTINLDPATLGSVLFNATPTQWLSIPNNAAFSQDTAFTYEGWFYPTSLTACYPFIMLQNNWIGVTYRNSGKFILDMSYVGTPPGYATLNTTYPINNWYHVALTWTGSAGKLFINGAQEAIFTGAGATVSDGKPLYIGQYQDQGFASFQGNMSNFRVVKGTAVYTAPFTPPTAPLTAISGTQLLLNTPNNANLLVDSSVNNFTVTNNGAVTSSALNPF